MESNYEMIESLKTFPLLKRLPDKDLETLAAVINEKSFSAGTEIIKEGEDGDEMFLLLEGTVDVLKTTLYGDSYITASLKDEYHCSFGEMALIDQGKRSATIKANTDCKTLTLNAAAFQKLCRENPNIGLELLMSITMTLVRNLRAENENLHIVYEALIEEIENN